jgi:hypothetical protein
MRAKYEKPQIGKNKDGEKVVGYLTVSEKVILEGKIDKPEAWKNKKKAKSHDQPVVNSLFA